MSDVARWLNELGLGKYVDVFAENDVDFDVLPYLTEAHLKELGVSLGDRVRLKKAIDAIVSDDSNLRATRARSARDSATGAAADAERRQLTVMFCDLVGSTALSTRLDPEDLSEVITAFQDHCRRAIYRYEGFIARYMGDGLLVYFGYPQAHEHDAERAVRAGLAAVQEIPLLNDEVGRRYNVELAVRIGVATGPVVVGDMIGDGASEEAAVIGETPNLAARLQSLARPNQMVIASATHAILGAMFDCEDLGEQRLKGISEPVRAWIVLGECEAQERHRTGPPGEESLLVGRQEELGLMIRAWETVKEGHGQAVLIQGEAGIGKSRMVDALRQQLKTERHLWIANRCSPYHADSTLFPVIEHLKRAVGWEREDDAKDRLTKLETALAGQNLPLEEAVPLYAELMGLTLPEGRYPPLSLDARKKRERILDGLAGWLLDEAERIPLLNVWEDIHWADPTTLELLDLLIEQSPTVSMLNVLTFRPEITPPFTAHSHVVPIALNRLERPEVEVMIGIQANGKGVPRVVIDHIVEKADGVPLYVEELSKTILASEYIQELPDGYALTGSISALSIPATLQDSLMARLDRVPLLRELAQRGAVFGREFTYEMLQHVSRLNDEALETGLEDLVHNEILYQRGRPPHSRYIFKHALIRDAAYQSLLKRNRRRYHEQAAKLLEERFGEIVVAQPELVAHHYREAGCDTEAVSFFRKAGLVALGRSANTEAATHFKNALQLIPRLDDNPARQALELEIQMALGPTLVASRGFADADVGRAYARALELCEQLGETSHLPLILRGRQVFHLLRGELKKAREFADDLLHLAERRRDSALRVGGYHALGQTLFFLGELSESKTTVEKGVQLFDPERHRLPNWSGGQPGEQCHLYGAFSLWMLGHIDDARGLAGTALELARNYSNPANLINTLAFVATLHALQRDPDAALVLAKTTIQLSTEHSNPTFLGQGAVIGGWARAVQGEFEEGTREIDRGILTFRVTGAKTWLPYFLGLRADVYGRGNDRENGLDAVNEALRLARETDQACWLAELNRVKGDLIVLDSPEDVSKAESCFSTALEIARHQKAKSWELRASVSMGRLMQLEGRTGEASGLLSGICDWFGEKIDSPDLEDARVLLKALS